MASKRYKKLPEKTKDLNADVIEKLLPEVKKNCTTKFDESLDLSFQINNKQKKSEVNIRTVVNLPGGTGKKVKVAVVCEDNKAQEAKDAGADIVGSDEFIEKIKGGELNFEKLICTPGMMIKLSKLGKVLGPKGLMPNPKLGSVSENIKEAVTNAKSGQVEITVYKDKKFDFKIKSPPASFFIKEAVKLKGGSKEPGRNIVASISKKQLEDIANQKMNDLNAHNLEEAVKIIAGSARSMGIEVKE